MDGGFLNLSQTSAYDALVGLVVVVLLEIDGGVAIRVAFVSRADDDMLVDVALCGEDTVVVLAVVGVGVGVGVGLGVGVGVRVGVEVGVAAAV